MNVEATGAPNFKAAVYDPAALPIADNAEREAEQAPPSVAAGSLSTIERQFAHVVKDLTQQLSSLEKQLMQVLRQLTPGWPAQQSVGDQSGTPVHGCPAFQRYGKIITEAASRHEVDPLLVGAVISQESGFRANAVSKTGAAGLMQLMPDTARSLGVRDAFDPRENVEGGTALLRQLLDRYNGQLDLALAAYNAGPAAVDKYGGVPPFPETQAYVKSVLSSYRVGALGASPA